LRQNPSAALWLKSASALAVYLTVNNIAARVGYFALLFDTDTFGHRISLESSGTDP
jgi:hypothetical protein